LEITYKLDMGSSYSILLGLWVETNPPLGREGTHKNGLFYTILGPVAVVLIGWLAINLIDVYRGYKEHTLSDEVENSLKKLMPTITAEINKHIDDKFAALERDKIEPLRTDVSKLTRDLDALRGDLRNLEAGIPTTRLRAEAAKIGIQSAKLVLLNLNERKKFSEVFFWNKEKILIQVAYEVLGVQEGNLAMTVQFTPVFNGVEGQKSPKLPIKVPLNFKGARVEYEFVLPDGRTYSPPPILLAIVGRNSPNEVILATGIQGDSPKS
jgi:hypothetical protein